MNVHGEKFKELCAGKVKKAGRHFLWKKKTKLCVLWGQCTFAELKLHAKSVVLSNFTEKIQPMSDASLY